MDESIINKVLDYCSQKGLVRTKLTNREFKDINYILNINPTKFSYLKKVLLIAEDGDVDNIIQGYKSIHKVYKELNTTPKRSFNDVYEILKSNISPNTSSEFPEIIKEIKIYKELETKGFLTEIEIEKHLELIMECFRATLFNTSNIEKLNNELMKFNLIINTKRTPMKISLIK